MRVSCSGQNVDVSYGIFRKKPVSISDSDPASSLNGMRTWRVRQLLGKIEKLPVGAIKSGVADNLALRKSLRKHGPSVRITYDTAGITTLKKGTIYHATITPENAGSLGLSSRDWCAVGYVLLKNQHSQELHDAILNASNSKEKAEDKKSKKISIKAFIAGAAVGIAAGLVAPVEKVPGGIFVRIVIGFTAFAIVRGIDDIRGIFKTMRSIELVRILLLEKTQPRGASGKVKQDDSRLEKTGAVARLPANAADNDWQDDLRLMIALGKSGVDTDKYFYIDNNPRQFRSYHMPMRIDFKQMGRDAVVLKLEGRLQNAGF